MRLIPQEKLNKALDKALLKYRPFISEIELFKTENLNVLPIKNPSNPVIAAFIKLVNTILILKKQLNCYRY